MRKYSRSSSHLQLFTAMLAYQPQRNTTFQYMYMERYEDAVVSSSVLSARGRGPALRAAGSIRSKTLLNYLLLLRLNK